MNNKRKVRPRKRNPLREARAEMLLQRLHDDGILALNEDRLRLFRWQGWSRAEVRSALNDLLQRGAASVETIGDVLVVKPAGEEVGECGLKNC